MVFNEMKESKRKMKTKKLSIKTLFTLSILINKETRSENNVSIQTNISNEKCKKNDKMLLNLCFSIVFFFDKTKK